MDLNELAGRIQTACLINGRFMLRSGRLTSHYFDKYQFEADPELLRPVAAALADLIPAGTEVLAGLEMGAIAIAASLSSHTGLPCAFVRKQPKPHGTQKLAEGAGVASRRLLIVEDVVTSGGQVVISGNQLRDLGAQVSEALCVVDRGEGGEEALADQGIRLNRLFRYDGKSLVP